MKELLVSYAGFNAWANERLLEAILPLPPDVQEQPLPGSFPSLRHTVLHLLDANCIWWQRLQLQEKITRPSDTFSGSFDDLAAALQKVDAEWCSYVQRSGAHVFTHEFIYRDGKRQMQKSTVADVLLHLVNHGTFHRGQLVTMLRQLGAEKLPATDYIQWTRRKG